MASSRRSSHVSMGARACCGQVGSRGPRSKPCLAMHLRNPWGSAQFVRRECSPPITRRAQNCGLRRQPATTARRASISAGFLARPKMCWIFRPAGISHRPRQIFEFLPGHDFDEEASMFGRVQDEGDAMAIALRGRQRSFVEVGAARLHAQQQPGRGSRLGFDSAVVTVGLGELEAEVAEDFEAVFVDSAVVFERDIDGVSVVGERCVASR